MSQPKKESDSEPSMEEILASIRKIISEDQQESSIEKTDSGNEREDSAGNASASEEFKPDDVLELTDIVTDSSDNEAGRSNPSPLPRKSVEELSQVNASVDDIIESGDDLVDVESARSATSSLSLLANAVSNEKASLSIGNGNQTIEDLMKEVMRPMVKDWLDKNLPDLVERLVKIEIKRITRDL